MHISDLIKLAKETLKFNIDTIRFYFRDCSELPLVSIIVPLYNEERFVVECLKSIKAQSYGNFECIVVNDVSTDSSREIVEEFVVNDDRFRIVDHHINQGLAATRNTGINNAQGKYITFLDSDDFLFQHSIWWRVAALFPYDADETFVGSYCSILLTKEKTNYWQILLYFLYSLKPYFKSSRDFISCRGECPFNVHAPLLKTDVVRKFGGFKESMHHGAEDWDLWLRILRHGYIFLPTCNIGAAYRQKDRSMVRVMPEKHAREATLLIEKAYRTLADDEVVPDVPYIFKHPLGYYDQQIILTRRLVKFATIAYLGGNINQFKTIINFIPKDLLYFLQRHVDFYEAIEDAYARFHGEVFFLKKEFCRDVAKTKQDILQLLFEQFE